MTNCKNCSGFQNRLRKAGLCDACAESRNSQATADGINSYYNSSIFNTSNFQSGLESPLRGPNPSLAGQPSLQQMLASQQGQIPSQNNFTIRQPLQDAPRCPQQMHTAPSNSNLQANQDQFMPQNNTSGIQPSIRHMAPQPSIITPQSLHNLMDKPISELTVADIIQINQISNDPIRQQLTSMENEFSKKFQQMQNKIEILDKEKTKLADENDVLRQTVTNIQKSLNKIDSDVRNKNVIIMGLPEEEVTALDDDTEMLRTDKEKIRALLKLMENDTFDDQIDTMDISRIGAAKAGYNRVIKIILPSIEERNEFLKNTSKIKDCADPWKKVFVKKDQHPVYIAENNRLRRKAGELKKKPGYDRKEVKIFNGKLMVNNNEIDQNLFFSLNADCTVTEVKNLLLEY